MRPADVSLPADVPGPVRLYRLDNLRRLVATLLVAAMGLPLVPVVGAQGGTSSLTAVLDDAEAFEVALSAARAADAGVDPLLVFAETYAAEVGDVSVEALVHLLGQSSLSGVLPPAHDEAIASAKLVGPPATSAATLGGVGHPAASAALVGPAQDATDEPPRRPLAPSARPRAP